MKYNHITTEEIVRTHDAASGIFQALIDEVKKLSNKKPDATLNKNKVDLINNLLSDLLSFLKDEPEGKYLKTLEDEDLPQVSDALLMMTQFDAALSAFRARYQDKSNYRSEWITEAYVNDEE